MNTVVDRVRIIRKVRFRLEDELGEMEICPECLGEVIDRLVALENMERDRDEMATIRDPDLGF